MRNDDAGSALPLRWDLVAPDQLGSLLAGIPEPDLWFADELVDCAARVLARSGGGPVFFVGRSLDSMYDLLSGMITDDARLRRLPFSTIGAGAMPSGRWRDEARGILARCGVTPFALARAGDPVTLVDVVSSGRTFEALHILVRDWVRDEREPWDVVRRKIRFVGLVKRGRTSPKTHRWQQHAAWTAELPAGAVSNVSVSFAVYRYLADYQEKLTRTFGPGAGGRLGVQHDDDTRRALAEAVALVAYGRRPETRARLIRLLSARKPYPRSWLAALRRF